MSARKGDDIEIVLELTHDEALGLLALLGNTTGILGYKIYSSLWGAMSPNNYLDAFTEAEKRFPDLVGTGRFR